VKTYGGVEYSSTIFLTSTVDAGEWSASRPCNFTRGVRTSVTHWIGGWMGPRVRLDAVEKRKMLQCRESNPCRPARSPTRRVVERYYGTAQLWTHRGSLHIFVRRDWRKLQKTSVRIMGVPAKTATQPLSAQVPCNVYLPCELLATRWKHREENHWTTKEYCAQRLQD
jgi:hypothetical protein